jgi:hypothetical protein
VVGELQGGAEGVGETQPPGVADAGQVQDQAADRVGRQPAIAQQRVGIGALVDADIHPEGGQRSRNGCGGKIVGA